MPDNSEAFTGPGISSSTSRIPQFTTADYPTKPGLTPCGLCGKPIGNVSYVVESAIACADCGAANETDALAGSHAFLQAVLFGIGAALVGLAFYAAFTIVTHFYIGYIALAVGWLVAKAMMAGSRGVGGPRYQIVAVILTYAAISFASIPILVTRVAQQNGDAQMNWPDLAGRLAAWGIASPFLQLQYGVSGAIGLVILFVGLRIAYRMTAAQRT